ncbi:putative phloem protein [Helianthus annuus]|nr:putative phloem protein [Helianthus annuus]
MESGRKCYMLGVRNLSIVWGGDTRYWEWGHSPESRCVWWLDIQGRIASAMLSPKTTYVAYLVFRVTRDSWGLSALGKTIVTFGGVRNETSNVYLQQPRTQAHTQTPRSDGWMEIKLGEFYNNNGDEGEIEMGFRSIMNIKEALWKVLRFGLSSVLIIDCE